MSVQTASGAVADRPCRPHREGGTAWFDALFDSDRAKAAYFGDCLQAATPRLRTYCRKLTRNDDAAEDLVQDATLRAWQARDSFALNSNMGAWVCRIARNTFLSRMRKHRREVPWDPDAHDRLLVTQPVQEEALLEGEFERALGNLPVEQREAFILVVQKGHSYDVAAAEMNVPNGTIRSRVARARLAIRRSCLGEGVGECARPPVKRSHNDNDNDNDVAADPAVVRPDAGYEPGERYAAWKKSGQRLIG